MRLAPLRLGVLTTTLLGLVQPWQAARADAQVTPERARSQSESGLTVTVEVFCSETKLRTGNARIQWGLSPTARAASGLTSLTTAKQSIETTVFANGFDKGLYVSLPVPSATPAQPVSPVAQARQGPMRAYQIQLIAVEQPRAAAIAEGSEIGAVVENLEPGMNYTWRVVIEPPGGRLMSTPITVTAPVCPADMIRPTETPRRRP